MLTLGLAAGVRKALAPFAPQHGPSRSLSSPQANQAGNPHPTGGVSSRQVLQGKNFAAANFSLSFPVCPWLPPNTGNANVRAQNFVQPFDKRDIRANFAVGLDLGQVSANCCGCCPGVLTWVLSLVRSASLPQHFAFWLVGGVEGESGKHFAVNPKSSPATDGGFCPL